MYMRVRVFTGRRSRTRDAGRIDRGVAVQAGYEEDMILSLSTVLLQTRTAFIMYVYIYIITIYIYICIERDIYIHINSNNQSIIVIVIVIIIIIIIIIIIGLVGDRRQGRPAADRQVWGLAGWEEEAARTASEGGRVCYNNIAMRILCLTIVIMIILTSIIILLLIIGGGVGSPRRCSCSPSGLLPHGDNANNNNHMNDSNTNMLT